MPDAAWLSHHAFAAMPQEPGEHRVKRGARSFWRVASDVHLEPA